MDGLSLTGVVRLAFLDKTPDLFPTIFAITQGIDNGFFIAFQRLADHLGFTYTALFCQAFDQNHLLLREAGLFANHLFSHFNTVSFTK